MSSRLVAILAWLAAAGADAPPVIPLGGAVDLCSAACDCTKPMAVRCDFGNRSVTLTNTSFAADAASIREVYLSGGGSVTVDKYALSAIRTLDVLIVDGVKQLTFRSKACKDLEPNNLKVFVSKCDSVTFETESFATKGPMVVNISHCGYVRLSKKPFSRVVELVLEVIPNLHLENGALYIENKNKSRWKIRFNQVLVPYIPKDAFCSSLLEVTIENTIIRSIKSGAFNAIEYDKIVISNSSIELIETGGFSSNTLIKNFTISKSKINNMEKEAIASHPEYLKVQYSIFQNMSSKAIISTCAKAFIIDNKFETFGLDLNSWNVLRIDGNYFGNLKKDSVFAPYQHNTDMNDSQFTFINNTIANAEQGSLEFIKKFPGHPAFQIVYENIDFIKTCSCNVSNWLEGILGGSVASMKDYVKESYCKVGANFPKCFNLSGVVSIEKFSKTICDDRKQLSCNPLQRKINGTVFFKDGESINSDYFEDNVDERSLLNDPTRLILYTLIILVICGVIILGTIATCKIAKRQGYCANVKSAVTSSNASCSAFFDRIFGLNYGLDTAGSINQIPVNEYTENHMLEERRPLNDDDISVFGGISVENLIDTMDKATQTLPEELTKELLESLREKLEDPDNYNEARETIEHLYDLIKVEEYCNMNNNNEVSASHVRNDRKDPENLYDVIQLPPYTQHTSSRNKKNMISVGTSTRDSIFDKTSQISPYNRQTALCHDYSEPKDRTTNLYCELSNSKPDNPTQPETIEGILRPTPLSYLRAIEMSIKNSKPSQNDSHLPTFRDNLIAGPSGMAAKSATQKSNKSNRSVASDSSASKMANRPLPEKPRIPP